MSSANGVKGDLVADMIRATEAVLKASAEAVEEAGGIMFEAAEEFTPVKRGALLKSLRIRKYHQPKSGRIGVEVTARTDYAYIVEKQQHYLERSYDVGAKAAERLSAEKVEAALSALEKK